MLLTFSRTGALPLSKVGTRLQVHPTSVTNAVNRLADDGLITRLPHPTDGRTTLAQITRAGRRLAGNATEALNRGVFQDPGLDPGARDDLVSALGQLRRRAGDFTTG